MTSIYHHDEDNKNKFVPTTSFVIGKTEYVWINFFGNLWYRNKQMRLIILSLNIYLPIIEFFKNITTHSWTCTSSNRMAKNKTLEKSNSKDNKQKNEINFKRIAIIRFTINNIKNFFSQFIALVITLGPIVAYNKQWLHLKLCM